MLKIIFMIFFILFIFIFLNYLLKINNNENFKNNRRIDKTLKQNKIFLKKNIDNIKIKENIDNIKIKENIDNIKIKENNINIKIKKIINIYQEKYTNNTCPGLGDYLRGCYFILQFCKKFNIEYEFIIIHPISKYLKKKYNLNKNIPNDIKMNNENNYHFKIDQIKKDNYYINYDYNYDENFINNFKNYINNENIEDSTLYLLSNAYPINPISDDEKEVIRNLIEPNEEMIDFINYTLEKKKLKKYEYIIIHVRTGDKYLIENNKIENNFIDKIYNEINNIIQESNSNILLLSDNNDLKHEIFQKNNNIKIINTEISHIGENQILDDSKIKDNLLEFYIMSFSNKIYSLSIYEHGSGFSKWCAKTYNIPYSCKYIPI